MSEPPHERDFALEDLTDRLEVRPAATREEALELLPGEGDLWGYWTTPAEARLGRLAAREWRALLARPDLAEARVFDDTADLHWRGERGIRLAVAGAEAVGELAGGKEWRQRERRSRLWGEWLAEAGGWYEERIPDPLRYEGLAPGEESCLAFLVYREYVFRGAVQYVRYLRVEGEPR